MTAGRPLSRLLGEAGVVPLARDGGDPEVLGVCVDSRQVRPGDLFVALRGERHDGLTFVPDAIARGARAIVAESSRRWPATEAAWVRVGRARPAAARLARAWHAAPDLALTLVGVTGTNGKTTVSYLVQAMAEAGGLSAGRIGTNGFAFGDATSPSDRTTPEATEFYALLARMRDAGVALVAMEVSSHALSLHRVEGARFAVAAFLNLGHDHLDFHRTTEAYFEAKAILFDGLDASATAVVPYDDPRGEALAARTRARVLTWGRGSGASIRIRDERCGLDGGRAVFETPAGAIDIATPLAGRFNLDNTAAAAACALAAGVSPAAIAAGAAGLPTVPGRLERVAAGQPFGAFVDYAHTVQALETVLASVRDLQPKRLAVVFGCGGDRDRAKRPLMGRAAALAADAVWLTSDNPRSEDPLAILAEIRAGADAVPGGAGRVRVEPDRARAIAAAMAWARPGDAVVVAGKGHETTQVFRDRVVPFDDRDAVRAALAGLGWRGR